MNIRKLLGDLHLSVVSQVVSLCGSLASTLLLSKALGIRDFGYWQLFIFYFNYVGIFQFGLNDGVYLLIGGKRLRELDFKKVRSELWFGFGFQVVICIALCLLVSSISLEWQRKFVLLACILLMPVYNLSCYLGFLFQAVGYIRVYSLSNMLDRGLFLILMVILLSQRVDSFVFYIAVFVFAKLVQCAYFILIDPNVVFGKVLPLGPSIISCIATARVGIKLMITNLAGILLLGVARFVIDRTWDIKVFGQVSLALSMTTFFMVFITQLSLVLFPTLRRLSEKDASEFFSIFEAFLEILLPVVLVLYIPVNVLLDLWLPAYSDSLRYLAVLLPMCLFDGKMSALYSTYLKVFRFENVLLKLNICSLIISVVFSAIGGVLVVSIWFVLLTAVVSVCLRSVAAGFIIKKRLGITYRFNWSELGIVTVFLCGSLLLPLMTQFAVIAVCYSLYFVFSWKKVLCVKHYVFSKFIVK